MNRKDQKQNIQMNKEDHAIANRNRQIKIHTKQEDKKQTGIGEVADYSNRTHLCVIYRD